MAHHWPSSLFAPDGTVNYDYTMAHTHQPLLLSQFGSKTPLTNNVMMTLTAITFIKNNFIDHENNLYIIYKN